MCAGKTCVAVVAIVFIGSIRIVVVVHVVGSARLLLLVMLQ